MKCSSSWMPEPMHADRRQPVGEDGLHVDTSPRFATQPIERSVVEAAAEVGPQEKLPVIGRPSSGAEAGRAAPPSRPGAPWQRPDGRPRARPGTEARRRSRNASRRDRCPRAQSCARRPSPQSGSCVLGVGKTWCGGGGMTGTGGGGGIGSPSPRRRCRAATSRRVELTGSPPGPRSARQVGRPPRSPSRRATRRTRGRGACP